MPLRIFLLLALAILPRLAAAADPYAAELTPAVRARLETLARPRTVVGEFTESRHTPLKKKPVVVSGIVRIVRIDRARGLSLAYDQPGSPVVILDENGLLLRRADGREQPAPPEAAADLRLLHALFTFDFATLEKSYALAATESADGAWTLVFTRRPEAAATYRELTLAGDATRLTRIVLAKTPNLHTDIALKPPQLDLSFTPEDLARYFR
jgi:hypothetical protein